MVWISGQQLQGGKYVIKQLLGQGGFGITYKAHHTELNTFVVIKTPNESLKNDPEYPKFIKRFREEGQRLEKLSEKQHPNIVRVRDLFDEGGIYCLIMDFVQGDSLFQLIQKRGALPTQEALQYIIQIGEALKVVHQAGLVHRDAHPGNIMIQQDGKAVLIDFGIAGETMPTTVSSRFFGNPGFAPHEQMRGDRKPYVDVYSLAASLYYAITAKRPTESFQRKAYNMPFVSPQEHISSISNELNQAILQGMEVEPENRPQSMQEWLKLLTDEVATIWKSGDQLQNGKYIIENDIAQGGFGITYLARDENNQRLVIKTLNERVQRRPDFVKLQQDFLNEAVKLAKCNHSHVVKVREVFQEGQLWCMAMEYIEGEHLADRVQRLGVLSEAEALGYIQQIGEALTVAHQNGLLHRDVKPANIIVRSHKREAVLIDFGIAREFIPDLTQIHTPYLSHCFAPIEQYQAIAPRGAYTDVYALAATLYFLLTNRLPPVAPNRATGTALKSPQQINYSISDRVNQAILKGMEIEAKDRPQSIYEWLELLKEPQPQPKPVVPPPQLPVVAKSVNTTTSPSHISKNKWLISIAINVLFGLVGFSIYTNFYQKSTTITKSNTSITESVTPGPAISPEPSTSKPTISPVVQIFDPELIVNEITDPSQVRALNRILFNQISPGWTYRSGLKQDLIYRVGIALDGAIVGYKAVNQGANEAVNSTPLPNLLIRPPIAKEPIAQFRVGFTSTGALEVSPWRGFVKTPK